MLVPDAEAGFGFGFGLLLVLVGEGGGRLSSLLAPKTLLSHPMVERW